MDRGIKIAILAACLLSLGFGLVWDKVIDGARRTIKNEPDATGMGPVEATLKVGDTSLPAPQGTARIKSEGNVVVSNGGGAGAANVTVNPEPAKTILSGGIKVNADTPAHIKKWIEQEIIKDGQYKVQRGDSPRAIALTSACFRYLGKNEHDWLAVNPQYKNMDEFAKKLIAGTWLTIPQ